MPDIDQKPVVDPAPVDPKPEAKAEPKIYDEDYVKRLRDENKSFREKADTTAKERDELAKYKSEKETAELAAEKKWQELAEKSKAEAAESTKSAEEKVAKAERAVILAEAKARAAREGIKDLDDVKHLDLSSAKIEGDEVVGLDEIIEQAKEKKPHWFGKEEKKPDKSGAPPKSGGETPPKDVNAMDDAAWVAHKEKMGLTRSF